MKKTIILLMAALLCTGLLAGCGGSSSKTYADGTYEGKSSVYENTDGTTDGNGYGVVTITITDGKITECTYQTYETDGTLKDEDYGKQDGQIANKDYYQKAQKAVSACTEYANQLMANGQLDGIDAISGATVNYNEFQEAVEAALAQAEVK